MRKLTLTFLTVLLCLTSSVVWSETVSMDDLVKREGVYYKKFADVPFTGLVENYHKNGQVVKKGHYKDGKRHGLWETYDESGSLKETINFKNGKLDGTREYYLENGKVFVRSNYKDGKPHGPYKWYHENGQLSYKGKYKNGKAEDLWEYYNKYGELSDKIHYKEGVYHGQKTTHANGYLIKTETYRDGKRISCTGDGCTK
jgi:antitoxin component YwqK of YwqJK toxin-antitoxin module